MYLFVITNIFMITIISPVLKKKKYFMSPISHKINYTYQREKKGKGQSGMKIPETMLTLDKQHTGRRQTHRNKEMSDTNPSTTLDEPITRKG
jgi:hypothetical protein